MLPQVFQHRLIFVLCRAAQDPDGDRTHAPAQRRLCGVWTSVELKAALDRGYVLHAVHEAWLYGERTTTVFRDYIRENFKLKLEASGWPEHCTTPEARDAFLADAAEHLGIELDPERIEKNPGKRAVAKGNMNSSWASSPRTRFGQRRNT